MNDLSLNSELLWRFQPTGNLRPNTASGPGVFAVP